MLCVSTLFCLHLDTVSSELVVDASCIAATASLESLVTFTDLMNCGGNENSTCHSEIGSWILHLEVDQQELSSLARNPERR